MYFYRILRSFAFAAFAAQKLVIVADKYMRLFVEMPCLQEGLFRVVAVVVEFDSIDCTVDFVVAGSLQDEIGAIVVHFLAHNPIDFLLLIDIFVPTLAVVPVVETVVAAAVVVGTTMIEVECFAHSIAIAVWHPSDHFADFVVPLGTHLLTCLSPASMSGISRKLTVMWKALEEQGNSTTTHQQHHKNFPTVSAVVVADVRIAGFAAEMLPLAENCNSFDSTLKNRRCKKCITKMHGIKNTLCGHTWK